MDTRKLTGAEAIVEGLIAHDIEVEALCFDQAAAAPERNELMIEAGVRVMVMAIVGCRRGLCRRYGQHAKD